MKAIVEVVNLKIVDVSYYKQYYRPDHARAPLIHLLGANGLFIWIVR